MKRWIVVMLICAGCGSSNPVDSPKTPDPGSQAPMVTIRVADFDAYVGLMRETFVSVYVMIDEFTVISQDWVGERVAVYWTYQYTLNLLKRLQLVQEKARSIRPEQPDLRRIHTEYEQALDVYQEAYQEFLVQLEYPDADAVERVNTKLGQGNIHMIRFQLQLSDLGGRDIQFGR